MNTANLQHAGVLAALGALIGLLRDKGIAGQSEIEDVLAKAEAALTADPRRAEDLSHANGEAMVFPLRFLRRVNASEQPGEDAGRFTQIAAEVGRQT